MSLQRESLVRLGALVVLGSAGLAAAFSPDSPVQAQCNGGDYALHQSGLVGWAYINSTRTVEWWAYIDGAYQWGDSSSVGANHGQRNGESSAPGACAAWEAWNASGMGRGAAPGHTIVDKHDVVAKPKR